MVSDKQQGREPTPPRRTLGDVQRRQRLADAAVGIPLEPHDWTSQVARFRVVIYLCGAANADMSVPLQEAKGYAEAFGWDVTAVIEERAGLGHPKDRSGLDEAMERLKQKEAGAVLTPWRSMISPIAEEYAEVARLAEKFGGFLQVVASDRVRARAEG